MSKIVQIGIAVALAVSSANLALAEEFDPIADLANGDALLGLDLPSDLEPLAIPGDAATGDEFFPAASAPNDSFLGLDLPEDFGESTPATPSEEPTEPIPATTVATTAGSGGAIGDKPPASGEITQVISTQTFYTPTPSSFFDSQIASAALLDSQHDYSLHSTANRAQLAETGPAATAATAFLTAIGLAFLFRKKFSRV